MDLLFRIVTPRNLLLAAAAVALVFLWYLVEPYPRRIYQEWRYPPQAGPASGGQEILEGIERGQARRVEARYRQVWAKLDEAERSGFDARGLRAKARAALSWNQPGLQRQALRALSEVEMVLSRPKARYVPASPSDEETEILPDVKPSKTGTRVQKRAR